MSPRNRKSRRYAAPSLADHALLLEPGDLVGIERERLDEGEEAPEPGEHAVPPALGQPPREHLEHRAVVRRAVPHPGVEHGELVAIGQQAGAVGHGDAPRCSHSDYNTAPSSRVRPLPRSAPVVRTSVASRARSLPVDERERAEALATAYEDRLVGELCGRATRTGRVLHPARPRGLDPRPGPDRWHDAGARPGLRHRPLPGRGGPPARCPRGARVRPRPRGGPDRPAPAPGRGPVRPGRGDRGPGAGRGRAHCLGRARSSMR